MLSLYSYLLCMYNSENMSLFYYHDYVCACDMINHNCQVWFFMLSLFSCLIFMYLLEEISLFYHCAYVYASDMMNHDSMRNCLCELTAFSVLLTCLVLFILLINYKCSYILNIFCCNHNNVNHIEDVHGSDHDQGPVLFFTTQCCQLYAGIVS